MENIEIPDDFYIYTYNTVYTTTNYLIHKSCVIIDKKFSNCKYISCTGNITNNAIDLLRYKCNTCNEFEEKTYFVNGKYNELYYYINFSIYDIKNAEHTLVISSNYFKVFKNLIEVLDYLAENYPECIRSSDIKIALKD